MRLFSVVEFKNELVFVNKTSAPQNNATYETKLKFEKSFSVI